MGRTMDRSRSGEVSRAYADPGQVASQAGAVGSWMLDPGRSTVGFATRTFWGLVPVRGTFAGASGSVEVTDGGEISGVLDIEAASVDTGQAQRDRHLRGGDFFDADRFPAMRVEIDRVDLLTPDRGLARGRMTIVGRTQPLELDVAIALGSAGDRATVCGSVTIDRGAFGMGWSPLRMASMAVQVEVQLSFARIPA